MKKLNLLVITFALFFSSVSAALSGEYTINPLGNEKSNFNTFSEAITALVYEGIRSDVTFKIADGQYNEPLVISEFVNDENYNVTFTAQNGNVVFNSVNYALYLTKSNNIHFENIDFVSTVEKRGGVIQLHNATNNTFKNCSFEMITSGKEVENSFVVELSMGSNNNTFQNNDVKGVNGFSLTKLSNGNTISSNKIQVDLTAIEVLSATNSVIHDNNISANNIIESKGIVIDGAVGNIEITANQISGIAFGIEQALTYRPSEAPLSGLITNNVIATEETALSITNNTKALQIAFNTLKAEEAEAMIIKNQLSGNVEEVSLVGNNVIRQSKGNIVQIQSLNLFKTVDYNNLFSFNEFSAMLDNNLIASFDTWQEIAGSNNSISTNPKFIGLGNNQYTITADSPCIDAGPNAIVLGIINDIDGDVRDAHAEIGADEFNSLTVSKLVEEYNMATIDE